MSKKLLLADDSITIQKVIGITFANEDYELSVVDNGDTALEKARSMIPDLILADVFMPGRNGYELCAAVRQEPALRGIPVLLLTGTFEPFDENKARAVGADSWIAKPFESQALIDRVEELLARIPEPAPAAVETPVSAAVTPASPTVAPATSVTPVPDSDIWGDLAETGATETEVVSPAEFTAEDFPSAAAETPASEEALALEDDIWGDVSFDEEDLLAGEPAADTAEDIWGTMEEDGAADEVPPAVFAEESFIFEDEEELPTSETTATSSAAPSAMEEFVFEEEEETFVPMPAAELELLDEDILPLDDLDILEEEDLGEIAAAPVEETLSFAGEKESFATEALYAPGEIGEVPAFTAEAASEEQLDAFSGDFALTEEGPEWGIAEEPGAVIEPSAPVAEEFVITPVESAVEPEPVAPPVAAAAIEERVRAFSEEELAQIVERVAGSVIERLAGSVLEKIAWEVVPDLAENLVKEEIRKIRQEA